MLEAEYNTRHQPRVIIDYDDLLKDWQSAMMPLFSLLGDTVVITQSINQNITSFISSDLQHHMVSEGSEQVNFYIMAKKVFEIFSGKNIEESRHLLDEIYNELNEVTKQYTPWICQIVNLLKNIEESKIAYRNSKNDFLTDIKIKDSLIEQANKEMRLRDIKEAHDEGLKAAYLAEIMRMRSTFSWKITRPLRGVWNFFKLKKS
jgi:hypothetical protein